MGLIAQRMAGAVPALSALGALVAGGAAPEPVSACSRYDRCIDGLNRLPRPLLTLAVLGLFGHAMQDPAGFSLRMRALAEIPEPLWWLIGAVVTFYFGARETHYRRGRAPPPAMGDTPALTEWADAAALRDSGTHGLSPMRGPYQGHEPGS